MMQDQSNIRLSDPATVDGDQTEVELTAFATIRWARDLPLFVTGRGEVDINARYLALVLATYAKGKTGKDARPSLTTLMAVTGMEYSTIRDALKRLQKLGIVTLAGRLPSGVDCWSMALTADLSKLDTIDSRATRKREQDALRAARYRERKKERHAGLTVTDSDSRHAGSSVTSRGNDRDDHAGSAVTSRSIPPVTSIELPVGFELPSELPSLAAGAAKEERASVETKSSARKRESVLPASVKLMDRETLDSLFEHDRYGLRDSWDRYVAGVTALGGVIQPQYVERLQSLFFHGQIQLDFSTKRVNEVVDRLIGEYSYVVGWDKEAGEEIRKALPAPNAPWHTETLLTFFENEANGLQETGQEIRERLADITGRVHKERQQRQMDRIVAIRAEAEEEPETVELATVIPMQQNDEPELSTVDRNRIKQLAAKSRNRERARTEQGRQELLAKLHERELDAILSASPDELDALNDAFARDRAGEYISDTAEHIALREKHLGDLLVGVA